MEIQSDSDISEQWEDFFGSSTELTPSLLGIYDKLTKNLSKSDLNIGQEVSKYGNCQSSDFYTLEGSLLGNDNAKDTTTRHTEPLVLTNQRWFNASQKTLNCRSSNHSLTSNSSNIRELSPNVKRIITHVDKDNVESSDVTLHSQQLETAQEKGNCSKNCTCMTYSLSPSATPKLKLSHIPLSKITEKLSIQSGNELVQTFDSSPKFVKIEKITPNNKIGAYPFNSNRAVCQKTCKTHQNVPLVDLEQLAAANTQLRHTNLQQSISVDKNITRGSNSSDREGDCSMLSSHANGSFAVTEPIIPADLEEDNANINFDLIAANFNRLSFCDLKGNGVTNTKLIEAINVTLISKPFLRKLAGGCSDIAAPSLQACSRTKAEKTSAHINSRDNLLALPNIEQVPQPAEAKLSPESLNRPLDTKQKISQKAAGRGCMLADIALKNRPLSSSSICSTSSSSSSSSDHLNGKISNLYLASVESLAESENDLCTPHTGPRMFERACLEIVDSERSYVEDLGQVIKGYLHDWRERACLRLSELQILFSNIEDIYEFNETLLNRLINSGMDPCKIAKCFIDFQDHFDVYTTYCTSYPAAIFLLTKLLQATHTNALLASTQKMLQHRLPLGSYLLKPVQRILKYHLLLDSLRKHCDVREVVDALEIMRQVAHNIDQVKRKQEQQSRVKELCGILDGWLGPELTVLGELRQEGLLMEHNKPRLVLLFATMLIITKQKEDGRLQFKTYIHQNNLMLSEHLSGEPTSFYVIPFDEPRNQIKFTARNRDQKRVWTQHIKGVMLEKLDIPTRAKELVYQLGNDEDRTPDRSTWKWSLHSNSSTPTYLERRNACRRSEIRKRYSKYKRRSALDGEVEQETMRNFENHFNSADDTTIQKLIGAVPNSSSRINDTEVNNNGKEKAPTFKIKDCKHEHLEKENFMCIVRDHRSSMKSHLSHYNKLKERSKFTKSTGCIVDENPKEITALSRGTKLSLTERKDKGKGFYEVKQYNHKTMPKRIATLKKQRHGKKETSKFYMDVSEFDCSNETVLKITESMEELTQIEIDVELAEEVKEARLDIEENKVDHCYKLNIQDYKKLSVTEKSKRDAQIILDLLKNNKEFGRIYNRPQKRRESNPTITHNSLSPRQEEQLPPTPPSSSPPPLEPENFFTKQKQNKADDIEPIYETLLRNVHAPYKFSPLPGRANLDSSLKSPKLSPESEYVVLVYSPGALQQRTEEDGKTRPLMQTNEDSLTGRHCSFSNVYGSRANQDSVLSDIVSHEAECTSSRSIPKNIIKRLISNTSYSSSMINSETSLLPRALRSIDNFSVAFGRSNRPPERRLSDVSGMYRQRVLHRQGCAAVGERMAHVDYADPKALFGATASSDVSLQRDSVFSLTSSSDSMCEHHRKRSAVKLLKNFEYEQDVEDSLENDFRDSAIYSDDNEKRNGDTDLIKHTNLRAAQPDTPLQIEK